MLNKFKVLFFSLYVLLFAFVLSYISPKEPVTGCLSNLKRTTERKEPAVADCSTKRENSVNCTDCICGRVSLEPTIVGPNSGYFESTSAK